MWPEIFVLAVFLLFGGVLMTLFLMPLIQVALNVIILYFFFLRIRTEVRKYKRGEIFAYSFAASALILLITGNFLPLWWITTATILAFILTYLYRALQK